MPTLSSKAKDLTGLRFNRITVVGFNHSKSGRVYWDCQCNCGTKMIKRSDNVKTNISCGCYQKEKVTKHKMCGTSEYYAWHSMKDRCGNPNHKSYSDYGERGISVCDRWINSFENFFSDMGKRPEKHTLERIDNEGNYEPSNCKWATMREQNNNRRSNKLLTYNGKTQSVRMWEREMGFGRHLIQQRLKRGLSVKEAMQLKNKEKDHPNFS